MPEAKVQKINQKQQFFDLLSENDHEQVLICNDNATGLKAIIAIHNTTLGPALGGCRMWQYVSDYDALVDALRLSRGMTFKSAVAGLNLGGGKSVIIGDARTQKSEALLRRFGMFLNNLGGKYITAEDVGMGEQDMEFIGMESKFVSGLPEYSGGSGNPSPVTAYGTYLGLKAAIREATGSNSMEGRSAIVQGVGSVGLHLTKLLLKEGAKVYVHDIFDKAIKKAVDLGAEAISAEEVYTKNVDVYAPCALGATLNATTIPQLNCMVVAGAANNQLHNEDADGQALKNKGILYAPDFVINAGGIINVSLEVNGEYNYKKAMKMTERIYDTTLQIFKLAKNEDITTDQAARKLAEQRIQAIGHNRLFM